MAIFLVFGDLIALKDENVCTIIGSLIFMNKIVRTFCTLRTFPISWYFAKKLDYRKKNIGHKTNFS